MTRYIRENWHFLLFCSLAIIFVAGSFIHFVRKKSRLEAGFRQSMEAQRYHVESVEYQTVSDDFKAGSGCLGKRYVFGAVTSKGGVTYEVEACCADDGDRCTVVHAFPVAVDGPR